MKIIHLIYARVHGLTDCIAELRHKCICTEGPFDLEQEFAIFNRGPLGRVSYYVGCPISIFNPDEDGITDYTWEQIRSFDGLLQGGMECISTDYPEYTVISEDYY